MKNIGPLIALLLLLAMIVSQFIEEGKISEGGHAVAAVMPVFISVEVDKDTIKRTSAAFDGTPARVYVDGMPIYNVGATKEHYRYDINFRSTSNVPADEFVVDDPLEAVNKGGAGDKGYIRLEGLWTPAVWGDEDGRMNVWYKTHKKTNASGISAQEPSAPVTSGVLYGHVFPTYGFDETAQPDGWKLWRHIDQGADPSFLNTGVIRRVQLTIEELSLDPDDYVTALRFEYGAVKVGFTSKNYGDEIGEGFDALPMNTAANDGESNNPYHNTNGSDAYYGDIIEPLPVPAAPSAMPNSDAAPFIPLSDTVPLAQASAAAPDIPKKGSTNNWKPVKGKADYPTAAADAAQLGALGKTQNTSPLKPASYLVSATDVLFSVDIVSSAAAMIARDGIYGGLYDQDQDAVLTREIVTFTTNLRETDVRKNSEGPFLEHARNQGLMLKGGIWYDGNSKRAVLNNNAILLNVWMLLVLGIMICVALLVRTYVRLAPVPPAQKRQGRKNITLLSVFTLSIAFSLPMTVYSAELSGEQNAYGVIQVEYRFEEGEAPEVPQIIERYGFTFHLVSQTAPVPEKMLPETRTYRYRIEGELTEEQLTMTGGLGDLTIRPVKTVFEREVDMVTEIRMDTNDVDDIPESMGFQVTSATDPSGYEYKYLNRAGVTFEITEAIPAETAGGLDLPTGYIATVVYRGVETYAKVSGYFIDAVYRSQKTEAGADIYVIIADYRTDEMAQAGEDEVPLAATRGPDGGPYARSLLSALLSICCAAIAYLSFAMAIAGRRKLSKELNTYNKYGRGKLALMKWRNNILRAMTIIFGLLTLVSWLYLDDFSLAMVWINKYTPMIGFLFAITIGLYIFTYLHKKKMIESARKNLANLCALLSVTDNLNLSDH